ncbi:hypothetical protein F5Y18DRAFT_247645 [Xylariaceae sp. FL1019]|nr:hypothetical protein F5Y18DRAFT_247645 [Xylariaceae sp. FL1019]
MSASTIEDFDLFRTYFPPPSRKVAFLKDHLGEGMSDIEFADHFDEGVITDEPNEDNTERKYAWYAYSEYLSAYVTIMANLTRSSDINSSRFTEMRYRDMIIANIQDAEGDLKTLQWLIVRDIGNEPAREAIREHFKRAEKDWMTKCTVEQHPSDGDWEELSSRNPFTRGTVGLLEKYAEQMGFAKIKRVLFVSDGRRVLESQAGNPTVHILFELFHPSEHGNSSIGDPGDLDGTVV